MTRKAHVDAFGATALIGFSALMGINQVLIKLVNLGLQPVFAACLRSVGAILGVWLLIYLRGRPLRLRRDSLPAGLVIGALFAAEFTLLYTALDLTTVARTSVLFYTMPVWSGLAAHFLLPGERLTPSRTLGLALAFAGVGWAIFARGSGGESSLTGDLCALVASLGWAGILFTVRLSPLKADPPETQLFWQVLVSAPLLLLAALLFGDLIREPDWMTWTSLAVQVIVVVTLGFAMWFWLLTIYPAASVAAFGFLAPIFGVGFGWALLGEAVGPELLGSLALVAAGLWLVNRPRPQVPQKV